MRLAPTPLCVLGAVVGLAAAPPDPLVAGAAGRTQQLKTVEVRFRITEEWRRGAASGFKNRWRGLGPAPEKDVRFEAENTLLIAGSDFRYNYHEVSLYGGTLKQKRKAAAAKAGLLRQLFFDVPKDGHNLGTVEPGGRRDGVAGHETRPILLFCRGNDATLAAAPLPQFRRAGRRSLIAGTSCEEYALEARAGTTHIWGDPALGYQIRRIEVRNRGKPTSQSDIEYRENDSGRTFPSSWRCTRFDEGGRVLNVITAEVLDFDLNRPIGPSSFDLQFPPNTSWRDSRTGKLHRTDADGATGEVQRDEEPNPGRPATLPGPPARATNWWAMPALALVVAVLLVGAWMWRRRKVPS